MGRLCKAPCQRSAGKKLAMYSPVVCSIPGCSLGLEPFVCKPACYISEEICMKSLCKTVWTFSALSLALLLMSPTSSFGQGSLTSGDVTGTVVDPSGAAVPNATVTLKSNDTGATQNATTNATGAYRFHLLNPGSYTLAATAQGLQASQRALTVAVGQSSTVNLQMQVTSASQTVEVTAEAGVIQTDNGNVSTTISPEIVAEMPNPGNDLTYYIQTAPGTTMNTQGGYGNASSFGISATSNLFTVDGMNENDPFLNLNNSGATNLMLGANDVQTATVVNNGYTGEYGQLAGANVNT